jgi:hypothetical protein
MLRLDRLTVIVFPLCASLLTLPAAKVAGQDAPKQVPASKGDSATAAVKGPAFLVQPYLQLPTPTGMSILWETTPALPGRVEFGPTERLGEVAAAKGATALQEVRLTGLAPGTTYYYRVRSGELVSEVNTFKTAPPAETRRWRMALYGDSRSNPATHRKVAEQIAKAHVDLILHTGDIVANGLNHESWRTEFFEPLAPIAGHVPWVSTIGNHERDSANYFSYAALPGNERYFGFDYANAHIICLDSNSWIERGRDSPQLRWLEEHLREPRKATWTFVAFHHPLFSAHATRPINPLRWDWAPALLDPANRVDAVLTGHDHFFARNWRMGRVAEQAQPGVLFLTSAGGGASLYRTKPRDYIASENEAHHFTLFEFDGDRATLTAIDIRGKILDHYVLTKQPTPPGEYCAYEIEELRQFLRTGLTSAPALPIPPDGTASLNTELRIPTRFQVPVFGTMRWQSTPGWTFRQPVIPFRLNPHEPLVLPLKAAVAAGSFPHTPGLEITFQPGRFRNRAITVYPFKLAGPDSVHCRQVSGVPVLDGQLDDTAWSNAEAHSLLGLPPVGGRTDRVRFVADKEALYVAAQLDHLHPSVPWKASSSAEGSRLVLTGEHVRVLVSDGEQTVTFAVAPDQRRFTTATGGKGKTAAKAPAVAWRAAVGQQGEGWCVEMAIPRTLFPDAKELRVNVVHRRQDGSAFTDSELCPTYALGQDADLIPDWKPQELPARFARVVFE